MEVLNLSVICKRARPSSTPATDCDIPYLRSGATGARELGGKVADGRRAVEVEERTSRRSQGGINPKMVMAQTDS